MSVFTMPVSIAQTIERLKRDFFWGDGIQKRKIHSIKWATLCKSKKEGGLGVGSVLNLNKGLLAKWVWRFSVESSPLWKRAICAKYGIQKDILLWDWACGSNSLVFAKSIAKLLKNGSISTQILKEGVRVLVGKGDRTRLWSDIMVEGSSLKENGHDQKETIFKKVWLGICPPKIELFIWQLLHGRVLVREVLSKCGVQVVEWVTSRDLEGSNHEQIILHIRSNLVSFGQASVVYCPRNSNSFTDNLAKKGSAGCKDVLC
ncbi:hypothetical protein Ddye_006740 [Dipteronia dyeriana]|uniref:Reverse transcriptase zinc-binding domain-containing protein n=1 Tax=Dipteronia dyeriana TaxID=168575 RepID=A0AAE0CQZ2_9ROSI|nr:hypothetical protein Ddye_006740 [Dipteronia dyeriana]